MSRTAIQIFEDIKAEHAGKTDHYVARLEHIVLTALAGAMGARDTVERPVSDKSFTANGHAACHGWATGWLIALEVAQYGSAKIGK